MERRKFIELSSLLGAALLLGCKKPFGGGNSTGTVPVITKKTWKGWQKGQFQVHFIYTGVAESLFFIFPDGTTMLLDCGDHNVKSSAGEQAVPILPGDHLHAGEWIARYVQKVNPNGKSVDYMMLSHYHCDHAGSEVWYAGTETHSGESYVLSGFSQAAQQLDFSHAIDRLWPGYDTPLPMVDDANKVFTHMKKFYDYMQSSRGLQIESFRLGATDQIVPLHDTVKGFSVRNVCGNGYISLPDGSVQDLYAELKANPPEYFNDNGMSLGLEFSYGPFRFFTAGDFCASPTLPTGGKRNIEESLAAAVLPCDVSKVNHHGYQSMPAKLVSALRSRVWVSCVWRQDHNQSEVLSRLSSRSLYPGDRLICPGIFTPERKAADVGSSYLDDIAPASSTGGHIVLNVEEGGEKYTITYLDARDESLSVLSSAEFETFAK